MADRLTQLQDCYEQLATQFYASIRYLSTHHAASTLTPPQPPPSTHTTSVNSNAEPLTNNITANHQPPPTQSTQSQEQQPTTQPVQPSQDSQELTTNALPPEQRPDSPATFAAAQRELAHDLILKTQQIEYIISVLPGVENSKEKQEERIMELDEELRAALEERREAEGRREEWVRRVEGVVGSVRR